MRRAARLLLVAALTACSADPAPAPAGPQAAPPAPQGHQDQEAPPVPQPTASELKERARAALGLDAMMTRLTPPLPAAWPDAGGRVVLLAYGREPLPSGRVRYAVRSPRRAVEVDVVTGATRVLDLGEPTPLGEVEGSARRTPSGADELAAAEQALVDVVAGRRPAADARPALAAYRLWLEAEPLVADDLRARRGQAAFLDWLAGQ